jgi:small-conductance mechanosensitive channel
MEYFIVSSRDGNFGRAAQALNLNLIQEDRRLRAGPVLAEKLYYVLTQKLQINFNELPDRPDGEIDPTGDTQNIAAGKARRSIKIGAIGLDLWDVEIRIERFKVSDSIPVWLFSPRTVENVDKLYRRHGPGPVLQYLPASARIGIINNSPLWHWTIVLVSAAIAIAGGWSAQRILVGTLGRLNSPRASAIAEAAYGPVGLLGIAAAFHLIMFSLVSLPGPIAYSLRPVAEVLIVVGITWFGLRAVRIFSELSSKVYLDKILREGEWDARSRLTRLSVVKHVVTFIVVCAGLAVALQRLHLFETLSLSLLASAGAASVILGVAAHSVLGNIMAGIQIALTKPACIGDSICFQGQWGVVEEITYTYITIRTWDSRRLVVPLSYFIAHPFENWSMKSAQTISPIYLYVDYKMDVGTVRAKFEELLSANEDWDRQVPPVLEVTGVKQDSMELRALCSAKDPPSAWRLHCRLREELIAFVRELEGGRYLPKQRVAVGHEGDGSSHAGSTRESDAAEVVER